MARRCTASAAARMRWFCWIRAGVAPKYRPMTHNQPHADKSRHGSGWNDPRIAEAVGCCEDLCWRVRRQYVNEGIEAVVTRKKRATPPVPPIFDGEKEARLVQLACSQPPEGHARWSLRLLENKVVELKIVDRASDNTIGRVLKKTSSSRILKGNGSSRRRPMLRS